MKILMVTGFYNDSYSYQENMLAEAYTKAGHQVAIVASTQTNFANYNSNKGLRKRSYVENAVYGIVFRLRSLISLGPGKHIFTGLLKVLFKFRPNVIFVHNISYNALSIIIYRLIYGAKLMVDFHVDFSNAASCAYSKFILHRIINRFILNLFHLLGAEFFAVTPSSIRFSAQYYGLDEKVVKLLPLGAVPPKFNELELCQNRTQIRAKYRISAQSFLIFTGGKIAPSKRIDWQIENFLNISRSCNVTLVICGDAIDDCYLNELKGMSSSSTIVFTGWLSKVEIENLMLASDMAWFAGTQSVMWQQCMACSLPLLLTSNLTLPGEAQDVTYLKKYGGVFTSDDIKKYSTSVHGFVEKCVSDNDFHLSNRNAVYRCAAEFLDWNIIAEDSLR